MLRRLYRGWDDATLDLMTVTMCWEACICLLQAFHVVGSLYPICGYKPAPVGVLESEPVEGMMMSMSWKPCEGKCVTRCARHCAQCKGRVWSKASRAWAPWCEAYTRWVGLTRWRTHILAGPNACHCHWFCLTHIQRASACVSDALRTSLGCLHHRRPVGWPIASRGAVANCLMFASS